MNPENFRNPPNAYREVPFWSWNDILEPDELKRQIRLIQQGGWGGFFMHARIGLRTPYMGKQWLEAVEASIAEARQLGLGAWLYDEDKWPSGFAGGLSVASEPDFRASYLICKVDDRPALLKERLVAYAAREVEGRLVDLTANSLPAFDHPADRVIQFYVQTLPLGDTNWFNGFSYLNLLNPDAVKEFISSTHEVYARQAGQDFGETVPGLFTDEPCTYFRVNQAANPAASLPWERRLPQIFQQRRGYDLLEHLPSLYFDHGDYVRVRCDYWRTVTELFVENYTSQVHDWCTNHNLVFTGHFMSEDTLLTQIQWGLAAAMPHYAHMDYPGVDKLGRQIGKMYGTILTVKQLDSAVCQTGKSRALIENYALSAQNFAHRGRKWLGDWGAVLGANFHNLHLALYSMRGERKRDCPPNLSFQQPWWPENRLISDYIARLSYILSQGKRVTDILVIHPMGSAWAAYKPGASAGVEALDRRLDALLTCLLQNQRDFHLGDELMMLPGQPCQASVEVLAGQPPRLVLGQMAYSLVIVPPGITLQSHTIAKLAEFQAAGGPLLVLEPRPDHVDGRKSPHQLLPRATVTTLADLPARLDELLPFDVRVATRPDVWVHHRRAAQSELYFLANTSLEEGGEAEVQLRGFGRLESWDLASGDVRELSGRIVNGVTTLRLDLPPGGSQLLVLQHGADLCLDQDAPVPVVTRFLEGSWDLELRLSDPNSLTLDLAEIALPDQDLSRPADLDRFDKTVWGRPLPVLEAHRQLALQGVGTPFALRFQFESAILPQGSLGLVIESPEHFEITLNGSPVSSTNQASIEPIEAIGWWIDPSFRRLEIGGLVRKGTNQVILRGHFRTDSEIESIYLTGAFGVSSRRVREESRCNGMVFDRYRSAFRLTRLPRHAASDPLSGIDLTRGGLPFYAGRVRLGQDFDWDAGACPAWLEFGALNAAAARVWVNGQDCGATAWAPFRVEIGAALRRGRNRIEVELSGTLRNLLGPHHLAGGEQEYTGPDSYRSERLWTADTILVPYGFQSARICWNEVP